MASSTRRINEEEFQDRVDGELEKLHRPTRMQRRPLGTRVRTSCGCGHLYGLSVGNVVTLLIHNWQVPRHVAGDPKLFFGHANHERSISQDGETGGDRQKGGDRSNRAAQSGATGERHPGGGENKPATKDQDEKAMDRPRNR